MAFSLQAVCFDLDGTLLDTLADIATAANRALAAEGLPQHPMESYRRFVGDGVATLCRRAVPSAQSGDDVLNARCVEHFHREYQQCWREQTLLYPGIADLLDELTRRKVPLSVLSNKPHSFVQQCMRHYLADWPFRIALGQREGVPHKPDPTAALEIAAHLAIAPGDFLYLGDSNTDMRTARAAGMRAIGAAWGFRSREELLAAGAESVIDRPQALLACA